MAQPLGKDPDRAPGCQRRVHGLEHAGIPVHQIGIVLPAIHRDRPGRPHQGADEPLLE